jgi:hypothetical protein
MTPEAKLLTAKNLARQRILLYEISALRSLWLNEIDCRSLAESILITAQWFLAPFLLS